MRRQFISFSVSICMALSLSGCIQAVMGPDLAARPTPFVTEGAVHITEKRGITDTVITAKPAGDQAVVKFFYLGDRVYNASVTYTPFTPIIPETIKDQRDYWLVGFNMSQTPDRSFYAILRYPHSKPLMAHTTRDDFEMQVLTCPDGMKPKPAAEEAAAPAHRKGKRSKAKIAEPSDFAPPAEPAPDALFTESEPPFCYHDSLGAVQEAATKLLLNPSLRLGEPEDNTQEARDNASPWVRLTVTTP